MTNNIFRSTHIARSRRLVAVAASLMTLGGAGVLAVSSAHTVGAAQTCSATAGTPTATTAVASIQLDAAMITCAG